MKKRDSFNYYDTDEENIFDNESMYYYDDVRDPNNRRRPYNGTMEFTAVRGHNLDRNTRPLGNETMLIGVPPQYQYSNTRLNSFPTAAIPVVQQPLNVVNPQVPNAYYPLEQQPYAFNATPTPVNPYWNQAMTPVVGLNPATQPAPYLQQQYTNQFVPQPVAPVDFNQTMTLNPQQQGFYNQQPVYNPNPNFAYQPVSNATNQFTGTFPVPTQQPPVANPPVPQQQPATTTSAQAPSSPQPQVVIHREEPQGLNPYNSRQTQELINQTVKKQNEINKASYQKQVENEQKTKQLEQQVQGLQQILTNVTNNFGKKVSKLSDNLVNVQEMMRNRQTQTFSFKNEDATGELNNQNNTGSGSNK